MKRVILIFLLATVSALHADSQSLIWNGAVDTDFFNEANWWVEGSEVSPEAGTIEPDLAIAFNLVIEDAALDLGTTTSISFGSENGISLIGSTIELGSVGEGYFELSGESTLILHSTEPLSGTSVSLQDNKSWLKLLNVNGPEANQEYLNLVSVDGSTAVLDENIRINQYYFHGSLIRVKDAAETSITLYDGVGLSGESFEIPEFEIYSRNELGAFDNTASSFKLERGFVAVLSIFQNGTGKSETYIASEKSLELNLPDALDNTVSFVRVMPWNWVTKKGASKFTKIGATWTYNWNRTGESQLDLEYAPMAWGGGSATTGVVQEYIAMEKVTHVMGFNESDNCNDQSGQYGGLCQIEVAVPLFKNLMRSGLRLVSPSPRENGPLPGRWLSQFRDLAVETDVRYDVLGVHWYDWANNPPSSPFADPQEIFDRFKSYLDRVYAEHQMPIWITEFNANANRDASVHLAFLELALPYLESLDFIERYDYFEPNPEVAKNREDIEFAKFFQENGDVTELGRFYRDFESTPAIPEDTYSGSQFLSGLDGKVALSMELNQEEINEGEAIIITFRTDRSVGASESFDIEVNLESEQYILSTSIGEFAEGSRSLEVTLVAVDDDLVEEPLAGTISIKNLSSGISWEGSPLPFTMLSEDEVVVIPLGVEDELFSLYPNPTKRFVKIAGAEDIKEVKVMGLDGKEIKVQYSGNSIDLNQIEAGIYIINFMTKSGGIKSAMIRKN